MVGGARRWERAHAIVMDEDDAECAWVHAYLHRIEGDLPNAGYWYRRARRHVAAEPLDAEWDAIASALLCGARLIGAAGNSLPDRTLDAILASRDGRARGNER